MKTRYTIGFAGMVVALTAAGCDTASSDDVLPGHTRPVLEHDWPHPRDLRYGPGEFRPPDPVAALVTLTNGLRAFILPDSLDNLVQVTAALPLGALRERADEAGASDAIANAIVERLRASLPEDVLARTVTDRSPTALLLSVRTLPADWRTALAALAGAVTQPVDASSAAGSRGGGRGGRGGGGGGRGGGAVGELQRITSSPGPSPQPARSDAVRTLAARNVTPHAVVFAIAGAVTREVAEVALREAAGSWSLPEGALDAALAATPLARRDAADPLGLVDQQATQASVAIGHPLRAIDAADKPAIAVLAEVLNIRLNIATREMRGLTNRAAIDMPRTRSDAGMLLVRANSRAESAAPILHFALDELLRIRTAEGAPTEDELEQVKGGLTLGSWQASLDGARAAAATYALEVVRWGSLDRLNGWPAAVRAVTADQVVAAARTYIEPGLIAAAVIGPLDLIGRSLHPRWPLTLDALRPRLQVE